jgi:hypothetical protein
VSPPERFETVVGILRRGDELLPVRQALPGEEQLWSTARYLRGELARSLWLRRVDDQGREELTGPL